MTATLTQRDVTDLAGRHGFPSVSILMPLARDGGAPTQDRIRLHNLVRQAEHRLAATSVPPPAVQELLAPALPLAERTIRAAGRQRPGGLALFLAPGLTRCHALPAAAPELVSVGERFHLAPLLAMVGEDERFFVLALDLHGTYLFRGTRDGLRAVPMPGVPASLEEATRLDSRQERLQLHETGPARPGGRPAAVFHGHGEGGDDAKDRIARYFRAVDRGVHRALRGEHATLVLAGVDYLLPIYRRVATYPHLAEAPVPGSPRQLGRRVLHQRAWAVVRHRAHGARDAVARYRQLHGTGRTTDDLARIVAAAEAGQVESLLLPAQGVPSGDEPAAVVDQAVARTVACGGAVWVLAPDQLPASGLPAAILRY